MLGLHVCLPWWEEDRTTSDASGSHGCAPRLVEAPPDLVRFTRRAEPVWIRPPQRRSVLYAVRGVAGRSQTARSGE
jgi:hypothetical protein